MKRALLVVSIIFLFFASCVHTKTDGDHGRGGKKRIAIAVSGNMKNGYVIEEPVPSEAILNYGRKVKWNIINNTEDATITYVKVCDFDANGDKAPFEGTAADQVFEWNTELLPGEEHPEKESNSAKTLSNGETRSYKYGIEVKVKSGMNPEKRDPKVIITE